MIKTLCLSAPGRASNEFLSVWLVGTLGGGGWSPLLFILLVLMTKGLAHFMKSSRTVSFPYVHSLLGTSADVPPELKELGTVSTVFPESNSGLKGNSVFLGTITPELGVVKRDLAPTLLHSE